MKKFVLLGAVLCFVSQSTVTLARAERVDNNGKIGDYEIEPDDTNIMRLSEGLEQYMSEKQLPEIVEINSAEHNVSDVTKKIMKELYGVKNKKNSIKAEMPGFVIYVPNGVIKDGVRVYVADKGKGEDNVPIDEATKRYGNNWQLVITALKDVLATSNEQALEYGDSIDAAKIEASARTKKEVRGDFRIHLRESLSYRREEKWKKR